jgi:hypothetical protein
MPRRLPPIGGRRGMIWGPPTTPDGVPVSPVQSQISDLLRTYERHMTSGKITDSLEEARAHYSLAARAWAVAQRMKAMTEGR